MTPMSTCRQATSRRSHAIAAWLLAPVVAGGTCMGIGGGDAHAATPRLKVAVSVPSVLAGNSKHLWLANTGTSSVLEFATSSGAELRNVGGTRYRMDNSDAVAVSGTAVWVANASSNTVTEFNSKGGGLIRVLGAPKFQFEVPIAIAVAAHHVFVLNQDGTRILELSEATGKLVRILSGPRYHFFNTASMVVVRNDVWTANGGGQGTLTEFNATTGRVIRIVVPTRAHLGTPVAIATDGVHVWVANRSGNHLSEIDASRGTFIRTFRVQGATLDGVTSIAVAKRVVWVSRAGWRTLVIGVNSMTGRTVRCTAHKFGFPAVFSDGQHIWVVDRTESRLSEVIATNGKVLRVIFN